MSEELKTYRLWKPIEFSENWRACDTSILDDISSSWFKRRVTLTENSSEYRAFLDRLKREHAIETGVIERLYDLKKGITETFIKEGFVRSFLSHGDTDIPKNELMAHLNDHLDAVNFIFDVVKDDRPLGSSFVKELHQLVTRSQKFAEGRDQFGNKLKIELLKGAYKIRENNPTREDGTRILYCPPEHVDSEMDNLFRIYGSLLEEEVHPLLIATWFHHAFTTIHPFQDGNGRLARLLTSLIFVKFDFFPFNVLREEAKIKYIQALEKADEGLPQNLVNYFAEVQKRNIQKALNVKEVSSNSLQEVQAIFAKKVENWHQQKQQEHQKILAKNREEVFNYCSEILQERKAELKVQVNGGAEISIKSGSFAEEESQYKYYTHIAAYAELHNYFISRFLPKAWFTLRIRLSTDKIYQLGITIHHYGYEDTSLAIGSFLGFYSGESEGKIDTTLPLDIPPHVISIDGDISSKKKNIRSFIEHAMTLTLAQIASEIS